MFETLNTWINLGGFRPNHVVPSTARAFVFYHIRPAQKQTVVLEGGRWLQIMPGEVSLIGRLSGDSFICFKRVGDPGSGELVKLYSAAEITRYPEEAFTEWRLSQRNLYSAAWEVFNGPNRITITSERA